MKKFKAVAVVMMVAIMMFSLAGCGVDMNKVSGTWSVSTINGKSAADFAAENGVAEVFVQKNIEINDKTVKMSSIDGNGSVNAVSGDTVVRKNGVEANLGGVTFGFEYHDDNDTITYAIDMAGTQYNYVLKKGAYDLEGNFQAAQGAGAEEEGSEEGGEEGYDEEGYDDEEYYEE